MFGFYRLALAFLVLVTHIGGVEVAAGVAVWGFYLLSGFLMTGVLNTRYGFDQQGLARYALSRAMRLLPTYWVTIFLTFLLLSYLPSPVAPETVNSSLSIPASVHEWISNLIILGSTTFGIGRLDHALSPVSWAIDVEVLMYACSCLLLSRSERWARYVSIAMVTVFPLFWLAAKYFLARGQVSLANELVYSVLPVALMPYSLGCWLWFARDRISGFFSNSLVAGAAMIGLAVDFLWISQISVSVAYLASVPLMAVIVHWLSRLRWRGVPERLDGLAGAMSYPVYLTHFACAYVVAGAAANYRWGLTWNSGEMIRFNFFGFLAVTALVFLVALLLALLVEAPVESLRKRFKEAKGRKALMDPIGI